VKPHAPPGLPPVLRRAWASFWLARPWLTEEDVPEVRRLFDLWQERDTPNLANYRKLGIDQQITNIQKLLARRLPAQDEVPTSRSPLEDDMSTPQSEEEADRWAAMDALLDDE
jgi:hypothetical protein